MPISMKCPHCERAFKLKDELAGKRVTCSKCRKAFAVPTPAAAAVPASTAPTSAADAESLALSVLGEETAMKEEAKPAEAIGETITYKCQFCDHVNHFEARMAGKNAPCAECRRIVKVPLPVKEEAKDWRTVAAKPTLARQDTNQPEGAWGAAQAQAVSVEALKEAAAVGGDEVEREPRSWSMRIILGMTVLGVIGLIAFGTMWGIKRYQRGKLQRAMETALAHADAKFDPKGKSEKLKPEPSGLILTLAATHATTAGKPESAKEYLLLARSRFRATSPADCAALIEIACGLADLTGSPEEVEHGKRLDLTKGKIQSEMSATLSLLSAVIGEDGRDLRIYAFRLVTRHLAARGQVKVARVLAMSAPEAERSEILAVIGLELLGLGQRDVAEEMATAASVSHPEGASSLVALWLALGDPTAADKQKKAAEQAATVAPVPNNQTPTPATRVGYSEGYARQGNLEAARKLADSVGNPEDRLRARVAVASAMVDTKPDDVTDLEECAKMVEGGKKGPPVPPWLMMRLIQISAKAEKPELAKRFAAAIPDTGLRAWGQYETLRIRLGLTKAAADWNWAKEVGTPDQIAHGMAWMALARHNARILGGDDVYRDAEKWEKDLQPFGFAGVALANLPDQ